MEGDAVWPQERKSMFPENFGRRLVAKSYIDDILIYSRTFEDHLAHIKQVFKSISAVGLKAQPSKCVFGAQEVPCLGHI